MPTLRHFCLRQPLAPLARETRLVVVRTSEHDGRVRIVQFTKTGQRERADAFACSLLSPLSKNQREKLATAMAQVERSLIASMVQISVADPTSKDAQWCIGQYFTELSQRFEMGFDPARSRQAHGAPELAPPAGLYVAHLREEPAGLRWATVLRECYRGDQKRMVLRHKCQSWAGTPTTGAQRHPG